VETFRGEASSNTVQLSKPFVLSSPSGRIEASTQTSAHLRYAATRLLSPNG